MVPVCGTQSALGAAPEHVLIEEAVRAAYGAEALEPIPA